MIRTPWTRINAIRSAFELTVTENGETDITIDQVAVINTNVLLYWSWVEWLWMVTAVRVVYDINHFRRLSITAFGGRSLLQILHRCPRLPPDVSVKHVVIIRNDNRRDVSHGISKSPAKLVVLSQVI